MLKFFSRVEFCFQHPWPQFALTLLRPKSVIPSRADYFQSFVGLKNKQRSKNTLRQLQDGSNFILVGEAFINQRAGVDFSFRGNEKSE